MSLLFTVNNKLVSPNPETLLISPFKEIWERDTTEQKTFALEEFAFMEFMTSKKASNPYAGYDEAKRREKLLDQVITKAGWEEDDLIEKGMKKIIEFQEQASPTYSYYMSALSAASKMKAFFNTFDMNEANVKTGNPIYKPRDITSALNDTLKVLNNLNSMKEKVEQELYEATRTRGEKKISPFAKL